jgi:hypothetical protein
VRAALSCFAVVAALAAGAADRAGPPGASEAAAAFGRALVARNAGSLQPILPQEGRVHVMLSRMGPEDGRFGASQVVALFRDFLATGKVSAFEIVRCECDGASSALAHGRASIIDRDGKSARVGVHLGFEREGPRWVLREVKETPE